MLERILNCFIVLRLQKDVVKRVEEKAGVPRGSRGPAAARAA